MLVNSVMNNYTYNLNSSSIRGLAVFNVILWVFSSILNVISQVKSFNYTMLIIHLKCRRLFVSDIPILVTELLTIHLEHWITSRSEFGPVSSTVLPDYSDCAVVTIAKNCSTSPFIC